MVLNKYITVLLLCKLEFLEGWEGANQPSMWGRILTEPHVVRIIISNEIHPVPVIEIFSDHERTMKHAISVLEGVWDSGDIITLHFNHSHLSWELQENMNLI